MADLQGADFRHARLGSQNIYLCVVGPTTLLPSHVDPDQMMTFSSFRERNADLIVAMRRADMRGLDLSATPLTRSVRLKGSIYDDDTLWPVGFEESHRLNTGAIYVGRHAVDLSLLDLAGLHMEPHLGAMGLSPLVRLVEADDGTLYHTLSDAPRPMGEGGTQFTAQQRADGHLLRRLRDPRAYVSLLRRIGYPSERTERNAIADVCLKLGERSKSGSDASTSCASATTSWATPSTGSCRRAPRRCRSSARPTTTGRWRTSSTTCTAARARGPSGSRRGRPPVWSSHRRAA